MQDPRLPTNGPAKNETPPATDDWRKRSPGRKFMPLWWLLIGALVVWNIIGFFGPTTTNNSNRLTIPYSTFIEQVNSHNVSSVEVKGSQIDGTFTQNFTWPLSGTTKHTSKSFTTVLPSFGDQTLSQVLQKNGVQVTAQDPSNNNFWVSLLIQLLPLIFIVGFFIWLSRRAQGAQQGLFSFGQSKAKLYNKDTPKTTFDDVAGVEESKLELTEVVDYLKSPARFQRLGGKLPKGILLVGPPGTGKTLLAKAVAGEAAVPFFSMSGSEFVEMLVGVGASRVRDLFDKAKRSSPCIIFVDELDAVGRQRGAGLGGGNDEREQTLNQLLVEMDGFDPRTAVIVLAATNRPDVLDAALLRPGRFDRQVVVERPDRIGREAILRIHSRNVPLNPNVDFGVIARSTPGLVGADLANLVNEAALLAARKNLDNVTMACFDEALDKQMLGLSRPLILSAYERRTIAYHEGGHALAAMLLPEADPVHKVTIVPRGQALGVTQQLPIDERHNYSREYLLSRIVVALGGRVAEEQAIGTITTGAENDLKVISDLARQMVSRWGMSELVGTVAYTASDHQVFLGKELGQEREYSEQTAALIDREVSELIRQCYKQCEELLQANRDKLDRLAEALLEHESLDAKELKAVVFPNPDQAPIQTVGLA